MALVFLQKLKLINFMENSFNVCLCNFSCRSILKKVVVVISIAETVEFVCLTLFDLDALGFLGYPSKYHSGI